MAKIEPIDPGIATELYGIDPGMEVSGPGEIPLAQLIVMERKMRRKNVWRHFATAAFLRGRPRFLTGFSTGSLSK